MAIRERKTKDYDIKVTIVESDKSKQYTEIKADSNRFTLTGNLRAKDIDNAIGKVAYEINSHLRGKRERKKELELEKETEAIIKLLHNKNNIQK